MKRMKSTFQFFAMLCTVGMLAFSCSSDDNADSNNNPEGAITFKVDGVQHSTLPFVTNATVEDGLIYLTGVTADEVSKTISITLDGNAVGTYVLGENHASSGILFESIADDSNPEGGTMEMWSAPYGTGVNGEVIVTSVTSTHVTGTFQFKAKNLLGDQSVKVISEGSFNVKIFNYGGM